MWFRNMVSFLKKKDIKIEHYIRLFPFNDLNIFMHMQQEYAKLSIVELQWLENLWSHESVFKTVIVQASVNHSA